MLATVILATITSAVWGILWVTSGPRETDPGLSPASYRFCLCLSWALIAALVFLLREAPQ